MKTPDGTPISVRERVLLELARRDKTNINDMFAAITEAAATVLDVERVSIWQLHDAAEDPAADAKLVCKDLYLASEGKHVSFMPIHGRDFPTYLRAIGERRTITADDARRDGRTAEFTEFYLKPLGITSMMDVPIWQGGHVYGVLCLEHVGKTRRWRWDEQDFAINMADIATSSLEAAERVATSHRWASVIEAVSEAVIVMAPNGDIVQCNAAGHRLFRDEERHFRNRSELIAEIELVDAVDRPVAAEDWPMPRAKRKETVRGEIYGVVFRRTGERRYIRATCSPVYEDAGVVSYVLVVDDATEDVFVERLKRELLSGLAHELKTPLAIAKGYAQQLESMHGLPARVYRMLDSIVHACDRMDHLSETVLDLASVILGRLRLTRERVDLVELVRSLVRRVQNGFPDRVVEVKAPDEALPVIVDATRISQAIRHLIDNAMMYSDKSTPVDVEISTSPTELTVTVVDRGVGIPEHLQSKLFDPFFKVRVGSEHDVGGLGIGLYLAREIVRRHGGDIRFDTAAGKGSTFYLTLPRNGGS